MLGDAGGIGEGHSNRFMNKIVQVSKVGVRTKPDLLIVCANSKMIYTYSVVALYPCFLIPAFSLAYSASNIWWRHKAWVQGYSVYTCMRYLPTPIHLSPFLTAIRVSCTALDPGLLAERCVCVCLCMHACVRTCVSGEVDSNLMHRNCHDTVGWLQYTYFDNLMTVAQPTTQCSGPTDSSATEWERG